MLREGRAGPGVLGGTPGGNKPLKATGTDVITSGDPEGSIAVEHQKVSGQPGASSETSGSEIDEDWAEVDEPSDVMSANESPRESEDERRAAAAAAADKGKPSLPIYRRDAALKPSPDPTASALRDQAETAGQQQSKQLEPAQATSTTANLSSTKSRASSEIEAATWEEQRGQAATKALDSQGGSSQQPASAAGWGWNAWNKIGSSIKDVAAGAARDVKELTDSLQQAMLAEDSDEDSSAPAPAGRLKAQAGAAAAPDVASTDCSTRAASGTAASPARTAQQQGRAGPKPRVSPRQSDALPEQEAKRREVLARLQGDDPSLETGLKAIDDQVEQLAMVVSRTFGGLWGGTARTLQTAMTAAGRLAAQAEAAAAAAAKELADTVEEGVRDMRELQPLRAATSGLTAAAGNTRKVGGMLANRAEAGLESFAMGFLGPGAPPGAGTLGSGTVTFERAFHHHGGRQSADELDALSNDCARLANRVRAKLHPDRALALDASLACLGPLFDLGNVEEDEVDVQRAASSPIARGHSVISNLCAAGLERAADLTRELKHAAAAQPAQPPAESASSPEPAAAPPAAPGTDADHATMLRSADDGAAAAAAGPRPAAPQQAVSAPPADARLAAVRQEALVRLAELAALCMERLLALGRSVSAQFRYGRPADDGIAWPPAAEEKAGMLRAQAHRMASALDTVSTAFMVALADAGHALDSMLGRPDPSRPALQAQLAALTGALEEDAAAANARLAEGLRSLLYVVLLTTLPRDHITAS